MKRTFDQVCISSSHASSPSSKKPAKVNAAKSSLEAIVKLLGDSLKSTPCPPPVDDKTEKARLRAMRNRASAQESRERKKRKMDQLDSENSNLRKMNESLMERIASLEKTNSQLVSQLTILSSQVGTLLEQQKGTQQASSELGLGLKIDGVPMFPTCTDAGIQTPTSTLFADCSFLSGDANTTLPTNDSLSSLFDSSSNQSSTSDSDVGFLESLFSVDTQANIPSGNTSSLFASNEISTLLNPSTHSTNQESASSITSTNLFDTLATLPPTSQPAALFDQQRVSQPSSQALTPDISSDPEEVEIQIKSFLTRMMRSGPQTKSTDSSLPILQVVSKNPPVSAPVSTITIQAHLLALLLIHQAFFQILFSMKRRKLVPLSSTTVQHILTLNSCLKGSAETISVIRSCLNNGICSLRLSGEHVEKCPSGSSPFIDENASCFSAGGLYLQAVKPKPVSLSSKHGLKFKDRFPISLSWLELLSVKK